MTKRETVLEVREIDTGTGEVIASGTRKKWFQNFRPGKGYLYKPQEHYIRKFTGSPLPADMIPEDVQRLERIIRFMENDSNRLVYTSNHVHKPMTIAHMAAKLHITYNLATRFVNRMLNLHIFARVTTETEKGSGVTAYYINPLYYMRGKYLSFQLYCLFQKELDDSGTVPEWVRRRFAEEHPSKDDEQRRQFEPIPQDEAG